MTKKQALDAASAQLAMKHAAAHPEGGGCIQRRSTVAAWGAVIRALRRRYRKGDDACPCALLTKKVKTRRVYRAVRAGSSENVADLDGWEIVLGAVEDAHHAAPAPAVEDARERERGGFGVRAGIGASSATDDVKRLFNNGGGAMDVANNIAARRVARAASWKRRVNATYELDRCDNPWADEDDGGACGRGSADEARRLAEAAEKRRRSRLGSW